ncbi:MAG: PAS domain-containing sensor histidine kinase [Planctomycetaceae bacterium]|nr:PAS domain-containing sensor histidine kinase [Planctomycetaceae bacterium]
MTDVISNEKLNFIIKLKSKSLEVIFDAVPVGLLLVDDNLNVDRVNEAIRRRIGKSYKEIINNSICDVLNCKIAADNEKCHDESHCGQCLLKTNINNVFKTSKSVEELEVESKTLFSDKDEKFWFSLTIKPVIVDERKHVVVCINDITARKIAEEKAVESMKLKQQFISTVSHELRTPLTAIREGLNVVLEGVAGKLKSKQREFLELSKRNVDRLSALINDVLDFQKLESGRMSFDFARADMAETIKEAADTMQLMAKNFKVELSVEIEPQVGTAVFDRNKMIQVFTNLLSNSIKFTPAGGKVSIVTKLFNDTVAITVSDNGMGIPKEDLPKVFERFYRVQRPGKEIAGTGLGLPIVAQIVERHNGTISVESELNKGTSFTVSLPLKGPQVELDEGKDELLENTITH